MCDKQPWTQVARLDIRVPGYTARVDTGAAFPADPAFEAGWVAQFGAPQRRMAVTRNEGTTGVTGATGWALHLNEGAPEELLLFVTQVPSSGMPDGAHRRSCAVCRALAVG